METQSIQPHWEHFPHDADVGIRGIGDSLEQAFAMAALALTAVVTHPDRVVPRETVRVICHSTPGNDFELLFFDWINALVFEMDTRKMVFSRFAVTIEDGALHAELRGESLDVLRHEPAVEVKGATMTELQVVHSGNLWTAQCVVDV